MILCREKVCGGKCGNEGVEVWKNHLLVCVRGYVACESTATQYPIIVPSYPSNV